MNISINHKTANNLAAGCKRDKSYELLAGVASNYDKLSCH